MKDRLTKMSLDYNTLACAPDYKSDNKIFTVDEGKARKNHAARQNLICQHDQSYFKHTASHETLHNLATQTIPIDGLAVDKNGDVSLVPVSSTAPSLSQFELAIDNGRYSW